MEYINITEGTVSAIYTATGYIFSSLTPVFAVIIAIPLTFYIARKIIGLFPKK